MASEATAKTYSVEEEAATRLASNRSLITAMHRALKDIADKKTTPLRDLPRALAKRRAETRPVAVQKAKRHLA